MPGADARVHDSDLERSEQLLIVEDSRTQSECLRRALLAHFPDHGIEQAESAAAAIELLAAMPGCAAIVCDMDLEREGDGARVIRDARRLHPRVTIVAVSAHMTAKRRADALASGANAAIRKGPRTLLELPGRLEILGGLA